MSPEATNQGTLQELTRKVDRLLEIEERRERRRKWGFVFSFLRLILYIAIPVGLGYALIQYFEDIFPIIVSKITSSLQQSFTSGVPPKIEITDDFLQQIKGMLQR
jgi:hypothetical protein